MTVYVDSHTTEGTTYEVKLTATGGSCSCPHYTKRLAGTQGICKHIKQARQERAVRLIQKAMALATHELEALLPRYEQQGRLELAVVIRGELADREAFAAQEAELKALFA